MSVFLLLLYWPGELHTGKNGWKPTYLPTHLLSTYKYNFYVLLTQQSACLPTYLPTYLHIHLPTYQYPASYPPTHLPAFLPTYLPTNQPINLSFSPHLYIIYINQGSTQMAFFIF